MSLLIGYYVLVHELVIVTPTRRIDRPDRPDRRGDEDLLCRVDKAYDIRFMSEISKVYLYS